MVWTKDRRPLDPLEGTREQLETGDPLEGLRGWLDPVEGRGRRVRLGRGGTLVFVAASSVDEGVYSCLVYSREDFLQGAHWVQRTRPSSCTVVTNKQTDRPRYMCSNRPRLFSCVHSCLVYSPLHQGPESPSVQVLVRGTFVPAQELLT